jgi:biotin operon repressor
LSLLEFLTAQPKTKRQLAELTGWHARNVEAEVNRLRLQGVPIISDGDGYRYARNADEVRACADALARRLVTQYRTVRALRRAARRMDEPPTLWDAA